MADSDLQKRDGGGGGMEGGRSSRPRDKAGGVGPGLKKFFLSLRDSVWSKNKGEWGGKQDTSGSANEKAARCVKRLVECASSLFFENFCFLVFALSSVITVSDR